MYELILTENRKKIKVLRSYSREHDAIYRFNKYRDKECFFPKKQIYKGKSLTPVIYEILLVKKKEDGDENIIIKDELGRNLEAKTKNDSVVIMNKVKYEMEEFFNVTDSNRKLTAKEIIDHVLLPRLKEDNPKQVLMLNNKVIIGDVGMNMITCKNVEEATRLYNKMRTWCYDNKKGNILFFGTIPKEDKKKWYKKLHELTGTKYNRLYRTSSR